jgi:hemoglobin
MLAWFGRGDMSTAKGTASLYDRLGGVHVIASVCDDFIDSIMDDPALNANPRVDEAHHRVSRSGFKYLVAEMVCSASGGPQRYSGKKMRESHEHLRITENEWSVFCKDLKDTLDKFKVREPEQQELFAIVQSTKQDIVMR